MINAHLFTARDIMTTKLVTMAPETQIFEAIAILLKYKISGAPVVDSDGSLCGIISEKDCMRILASGTYDHYEAAELLSVGKHMSADVLTLEPDAGIYHIVGLFDKHHVRRFPVVEKGKLLGQVSRRDVLKGIMKMEDELMQYFAHPLPENRRAPKLFISATGHDASEVASKLK